MGFHLGGGDQQRGYISSYEYLPSTLLFRMDVVGIAFYTDTVISRFITIQVSLLIAFETAIILTAELLRLIIVLVYKVQ